MRSELMMVAVLLSAAAVALCVLFNARLIGERLKIIDYPNNPRKQHIGAIPLVGGLAIVVPTLVWALVTGVWHPQNNSTGVMIAILVCGGGAALLGFIDDRFEASPALRLLALLALTPLGLILAPQLLPSQFIWGHMASTAVGPWLSYLLVAVGTAGFVNAVNMADGQDGCVAGMFAVWSACMFLVSDGSVAPILGIIFVTNLCVLAFNLRGLVFLGGAGAYGVTFVFAILILYLHNSRHATAETVMVWLFLPIVDCLRLMIARPISGRSPFAADRDHFHHRLERRFGKHMALAIYLGIVASTSIFATLEQNFAPACLLVLFTVYSLSMALTSQDANPVAAKIAAPK